MAQVAAGKEKDKAPQVETWGLRPGDEIDDTLVVIQDLKELFAWPKGTKVRPKA